jgi:hypothetical protein
VHVHMGKCMRVYVGVCACTVFLKKKDEVPKLQDIKITVKIAQKMRFLSSKTIKIAQRMGFLS